MAHRGLPYTKSTEKFISMADHFFDCLNVTKTYQGQKSNKPALFPYKDDGDWRFTVIRFL